MRSEKNLRKRLAKLEEIMAEQFARIVESKKGFGGPDSLRWDHHCVERATLRWVLGLKEKPFNAADCMAGW